jgi:hypothetical protein
MPLAYLTTRSKPSAAPGGFRRRPALAWASRGSLDSPLGLAGRRRSPRAGRHASRRDCRSSGRRAAGTTSGPAGLCRDRPDWDQPASSRGDAGLRRGQHRASLARRSCRPAVPRVLLDGKRHGTAPHLPNPPAAPLHGGAASGRAAGLPPRSSGRAQRSAFCCIVFLQRVCYNIFGQNQRPPGGSGSQWPWRASWHIQKRPAIV